MATNGQIQVTEGTGKYVATNQITEGGLTKQIQRLVNNDPYGNQIALSSVSSIIQTASQKSSGSVASINVAFGSNNVAGNTIIVVCAVGNGTAPTVSDSSNTYTQVAFEPNSTTFGVGIFMATNIATGANTVTVTNGGSSASMAMTIYEMSGLLAITSTQPASTGVNTGTSGTASTAAIQQATPNRYIFAGIAVGTTAETITPATGWSNDSGQQNPTTPAGLFSFVSMSQYLATVSSITPSATFTSKPWAIAAASFRPVALSVEGQVQLTDGVNTVNINAVSGQNGLYVTSNSATGIAVPSNAYYMGLNNGGGNLVGLVGGSVADAISAPSTTLFVDSFGMVYNGTNWDRVRSATAGQGTTGTGVFGSAELVWDGTDYQRRTTKSTSSTGAFPGDINIVELLGTTVNTAASGTILVGLADGSGNKINSTSNALNVQVENTTIAVTQSSGPWTSNITQYSGNAVASAGQNGVFSVGGQQATNNNVSTNGYPILVAGSDYGGTPKIQSIKSDSSGNLYVNTVSTVTAVTTVSTVTNVSEINGVSPTFNSTTTASKEALDVNILSILGTAPTTVGFLDIKGADGNVFVRQATAANLKAAVNLNDGSGNAINSTSNALNVSIQNTDVATNLAQVNGSTVSTAATGVQKVGIVGNAGATVDSTVGAGTAPANAIAVSSIYNNTPPAPTAGQALAQQADQAGNLRVFPGIALATLSTQGTTLNNTQTILTNSGAEAVLIQLTQTTTLTAGAVTFEVSYDGSTWLAVPANNVVDPTSTTYAQISIPYAVQASTNKYFLILMNGAQALRIRTSTAITGTGTVTPNYALLPYVPAQTVVALSPTAANFNVTVGNTTLAVTQSGTWNVGSSSATGSAVPANAFYVAGVNGGNLKGLTLDASGELILTGGTISAGDGMAWNNPSEILALPAVYNGSTWDRIRSASSGQGTTGTGVLGSAALGWDGTDYQRVGVNDTATSGKYGLDINVLSVLGTAPTTAGFIDIKGADGNVFVRQTTAANLNATVVGTGTFAVQASQTGNWTSRIVGNAGGIVDAAGQNASSPANELLVAGQFNTSPTTISSGNVSPLQLDSAGNLLVNVKAGSGGNAAASATGSAVPSSADYIGLNVGGTLRGATGVNPSGSVYAIQSDITSIGGSTVSTAATGIIKVGLTDGSGNAINSTSNALNVQVENTTLPITAPATETAGNITTSSSSVSAANLQGYGGFTQISVHGTYTGVSFGITASDDNSVTFYNVPIYDVTANQWLSPGATITPGSNASKVYWVPTYPNICAVKVLASAWSTGTANVRISNGAFTTNPGSTMAQIMDAAGNNRGANVDASNNLMVNIGAGNITGFATATNQTSGSQKTQIVDGSGNVIASTSNALNVQVENTTIAVTQSSGPWTSNITQYGSNAVAAAGQNGVFSVGGQQATNNNVSTNGFPVLVAGSDYGGTPKIQSIKSDSSGNLYVNTVTTVGTVSTVTAVTTVSTVTNVAELNGVGPTFNSTATSGKQGLDVNVLSILGTAPTTAGFIDIKGADGNVFVRQSTAANLKAAVNLNDGSGNAINSTSNALNVSITNTDVPTNVAQINGSTVSTAATGVQKVGIVGNTGATVDSTVGAGTAPTNAIAVSGIYNSTAPTPTSGQAVAMQLDQNGNLRNFPGMETATLSVWNSGTSVNATQNIFTNSGATAAIVQIDQSSGTFSAGAITFQVTFDGTNWITIPANCVVDPTSSTYAQISLPYTLVTSTNKPFLLINNGWQGLRIQLSTAITGSGTVTPNYNLVAFEALDTMVAYSPTPANFQATVTQASGDWNDNIAQIAGSTVNTAATGTILVGVADGSGNKINSTSNALNVSVTNTDVPTNVAQIAGNAVASAGQNGVLSIGGQQATNNNVSTNGFPVLIAGSDYGGTPKIQNLKVDSSGNLYVNTVSTVTGVTTVTTVSTVTNLAEIAGVVPTFNSTTTASKEALDVNVLSILGTAPTTAGKLDVKINDDKANTPVTSNISGTANVTTTAATSVIGAQGAGIKIYITSISLANTGTSTSLITIQQDPTGSPATLWYLINPAGGGDNITFSPPLPVAANKAVGFTAGTASTTQYISFNGYTGS